MSKIHFSVAALCILGACATPQDPYPRGVYQTTVETVRMDVKIGLETATVITEEAGEGVGNFRISVLSEIEVGVHTGCRNVTTLSNTQAQGTGTTTTTVQLALADCPPV